MSTMGVVSLGACNYNVLPFLNPRRNTIEDLWEHYQGERLAGYKPPRFA